MARAGGRGAVQGRQPKAEIGFYKACRGSMTYLLDTDVTVDYLNAHSASIDLVNPLLPQGVAISLVTYGEIYDGVYDGRNPGAAERAFLQFLRSVSVVPLNRATMREFARLRAPLRQQGMIIG